MRVKICRIMCSVCAEARATWNELPEDDEGFKIVEEGRVVAPQWIRDSQELYGKYNFEFLPVRSRAA